MVNLARHFARGGHLMSADAHQVVVTRRDTNPPRHHTPSLLIANLRLDTPELRSHGAPHRSPLGVEWRRERTHTRLHGDSRESARARPDRDDLARGRAVPGDGHHLGPRPLRGLYGLAAVSLRPADWLAAGRAQQLRSRRPRQRARDRSRQATGAPDRRAAGR